MFNESDIIRNLQSAFAMSPAGVRGIGDDAAVLPLNDRESYVISKDILAEHRHFRLSYGDAASLAHKALHVNLSDIAAMGAAPLFVMLGIALPPNLPEDYAKLFLKSFADACHAQNVILIGGDTTASERDLFLSVTVIGKAETKHLKFRDTAKAGDVICVAGALGESHAGLQLLEKNIAGHDAIKAKSTAPIARNGEGLWLGAQTAVTAMMDVSDGLTVDLGRMAAASQCAAVLDNEKFQPSPSLREACVALELDAVEAMLTGGEDYALLITVAAGAFKNLAAGFQKEFGYALMQVGVMTTGSGVSLREGGKLKPVTLRSFSHFGEL